MHNFWFRYALLQIRAFVVLLQCRMFYSTGKEIPNAHMHTLFPPTLHHRIVTQSLAKKNLIFL